VGCSRSIDVPPIASSRPGWSRIDEEALSRSEDARERAQVEAQGRGSEDRRRARVVGHGQVERHAGVGVVDRRILEGVDRTLGLDGELVHDAHEQRRVGPGVLEVQARGRELLRRVVAIQHAALHDAEQPRETAHRVAVRESALDVGVRCVLGDGQAHDRATEGLLLAEDHQRIGRLGAELVADLHLHVRQHPRERERLRTRDDDRFVAPEQRALRLAVEPGVGAHRVSAGRQVHAAVLLDQERAGLDDELRGRDRRVVLVDEPQRDLRAGTGVDAFRTPTRTATMTSMRTSSSGAGESAPISLDGAPGAPLANARGA
jgi:hypothetical protein